MSINVTVVEEVVNVNVSISSLASDLAIANALRAEVAATTSTQQAVLSAAARDDAEAARLGAENAEDGAVAAQGASELARDDAVIAKDDAEAAAALINGNVDFAGAVENDLLQRNNLGVFEAKSPTLVNQSITPFLASPLNGLIPVSFIHLWGDFKTPDSGQIPIDQVIDSVSYTIFNNLTVLNNTSAFLNIIYNGAISADDVSYSSFIIGIDTDNYILLRWSRNNFFVDQKLAGVTTSLLSVTTGIGGKRRIYVKNSIFFMQGAERRLQYISERNNVLRSAIFDASLTLEKCTFMGFTQPSSFPALGETNRVTVFGNQIISIGNSI